MNTVSSATTTRFALLTRARWPRAAGWALLLGCLGGWATSAQAQNSITTTFTPFTENFNSYLGTLGTIPAGWSVTFGGTAAYQGISTGASPAALTSSNGGAYAFGTSSEYSFGAHRSTTVGTMVLSVSFTNNTGITLDSLQFSWNYEQWAYNNTGGFSVAGTGAIAGNSALATHSFVGSATGTDGTVSTTAQSFTLTSLSIAPGATYGIDWSVTTGGGNQNGVGLDDFLMVSIPEPATGPALLGCAILIGAGWMRRRRAKRPVAV